MSPVGCYSDFSDRTHYDVTLLGPEITLCHTSIHSLAILEVSYSTRSEGICVGCSAYAAELLVFADLHWTLNLVAPSEELR